MPAYLTELANLYTPPILESSEDLTDDSTSVSVKVSEVEKSLLQTISEYSHEFNTVCQRGAEATQPKEFKACVTTMHDWIRENWETSQELMQAIDMLPLDAAKAAKLIEQFPDIALGMSANTIRNKRSATSVIVYDNRHQGDQSKVKIDAGVVRRRLEDALG